MNIYYLTQFHGPPGGALSLWAQVQQAQVGGPARNGSLFSKLTSGVRPAGGSGAGAIASAGLLPGLAAPIA